LYPFVLRSLAQPGVSKDRKLCNIEPFETHRWSDAPQGERISSLLEL
jgi:hypothetical protein